MTYEQMRAKVAASGGTLIGKRNKYQKGGWRTVLRASVQRHHNRYETSEKGKAQRTRYDASEKGKARSARKKLGRSNGELRLNRAGDRFREPDLLALLAEVGKACFVCRRPFAIIPTANGATPVRVDHEKATGFVRAPLCNEDNTIEGHLKKIGIRTLRDLLVWAVRMGALLEMPWLSMTPEEIRRAKRRAKRPA